MSGASNGGDVPSTPTEPDWREIADTWHGEQQKTLKAWQELYMERGRVIVKLAQLDLPKPFDIDISDFSDEWCAGFLAGQRHAAEVVEGVMHER